MNESKTNSTGVSWLTLLRQSDSASLGEGIERLARLAAAAHRQQAAQDAAGGRFAFDTRDGEAG